MKERSDKTGRLSLAEHARQRESSDLARLEVLLYQRGTGELSEEGAEELRLLARSLGWTEEDLAAFTPPSEQAGNRHLVGVEEALGRSKAKPASETLAFDAERKRRSPDQKLGKGFKRWFLAAAAMVAPALLALRIAFQPALSVLPAYDPGIRVLGGTRSAVQPSAEGPGSFGLDDRLEIGWRAEHPDSGEKKVRLYVGHDDAWQVSGLEPEPVADSSNFLLEATPRELGLLPGSWRLVSVIFRPEHDPEPEELRRELATLGAGEVLVRGDGWLASGTQLFEVEPSTRLVDYAGCRDFQRGACILEERALAGSSARLQLWVDTLLERQVEVFAFPGGRVPITLDEPVDSGLRFSVDLPQDASRLQLRLGGTKVWELPIRWRRTPLEVSELRKEADRLVDEATAEQCDAFGASARRALNRAPANHPGLRAEILAQIAQAQACVGTLAPAFGFGDRKQEPETLRRAILEEVSRLAEKAQRWFDYSWYAAELHHGDLARWSFAPALLRFTPIDEDDPLLPAEIRYLAAYSRGRWAQEVGDLGEAQKGLGRAHRIALRMGHAQWTVDSGEQLAVVAQELGSTSESLRLLAWLEPLAVKAGEERHRRFVINRLWTEFLATQSGAEISQETLEEAERVYRALADDPETDAAKLSQIRNHLVNLGLAYAMRRESSEVRGVLSRLEGLEPIPSARIEPWVQELEGRLALLEGRNQEALDLYRGLAASADGPAGLQSQWNARLGTAKALRAQGRLAEALAEAQRALEVLEEQIPKAPIADWRATFVASREEGARILVTVLLELGRVEEAAVEARRFRAWPIRNLAWLAKGPSASDEGERHQDLRRQILETRAADAEGSKPEKQLSKQEMEAQRARRARYDADTRRLVNLIDGLRLRTAPNRDLRLPALSPDELVLTFFPTLDDWAVFAFLDGEVRVRRVSGIEDYLEVEDYPALSQRLLQPHSQWLATVDRLRVLPYGALWRVDFESLPMGEGLLVDLVQVAYGLDLVDRGEELPLSLNNVLIIADPREDLPGARQEGLEVEETLKQQIPDLTVERLTGSDADYGAVVAGLREVDLAHFAGHGEDPGGHGWDTYLALASWDRLMPQEVLAMGSVPHTVVFSACETARPMGRVAVAGMGLPQAFLLAGSRQVIAATRKVTDQQARTFFGRFYRYLAAGTPLPQAFRQAQIEQRKSEPGRVWSAFRLLVP